MYAFDAKNNRWIPLRSTPEYRARKRKIRDAWIAVGLIMPILPLPVILVLALLGTFLSLTVLDESRYNFDVR